MKLWPCVPCDTSDKSSVVRVLSFVAAVATGQSLPHQPVLVQEEQVVICNILHTRLISHHAIYFSFLV